MASRVTPHLTHRQRQLVLALADSTLSVRAAALSISYHPSGAQRVVHLPHVAAAIAAARENHASEQVRRGSVLEAAWEIVRGRKASDMAKCRALELIADMQGYRQQLSAAAHAQASVIMPQQYRAPGGGIADLRATLLAASPPGDKGANGAEK